MPGPIYESAASNLLSQAQQLGLGDDLQVKNLIHLSAAAAEANVEGRGDQITPEHMQAMQALKERFASAQQNQLAQKQLGEFRTKAETQLLGAPGNTLAQALASPTSELGQLSSVLGQQSSDVFRQELRPQIENTLGSQGLLNSGAANELFSRELGRLQRARESTLSQAFFGGKEQLRGLERTDILGNIGAQQQALAQSFGLQRAGLTMQFQQSLENQRQNLERELAELAKPGLMQNILTGAQIFANVAGGAGQAGGQKGVKGLL